MNPIYGVSQCTDKITFPELSETKEIIIKGFGNGESSKWHLWYKYFDDSHKNWHEKTYLSALIDSVERDENKKYYVGILVSLGKAIEKNADEIIPNIRNKLLRDIQIK